MKRTPRRLLTIVPVCALMFAAIAVTPAHAEGLTRVFGTVMDIQGKPMPKVKIWFEAVDVKKRIGPLTTSKEGKYVIATLDISVAKKWKVVPDLPGYKTVKVHYEIVDTDGNDSGSGDNIMGSKQEYPELSFHLPGPFGRNQVDLTVAKEADFVAAVQAERKKKEGGGAAAATAAPAGTQLAGGDPSAPPVADLPKAGVEGLKKAKELADAGRHPEAIQMYRDYLAKDPTSNPNVYYYLGKSLFQSGDDAGAEQAFRKGLELQKDMKGAHFFLGNIQMRGEHFAEAAAEFELESSLTPDNDSVWVNLGVAYAKAGEADKAIPAFERASTINPARSETYMQLADIYEKRKDQAKAEEMYQKVIALDPGNAAKSFFNMGVHAWNENKDKEAAQAFKKAIEIDPNYGPAHKELARVLTRMQDFKGAVVHYQEYLKLNPQAPDAKEIRDMIATLKS